MKYGRRNLDLTFLAIGILYALGWSTFNIVVRAPNYAPYDEYSRVGLWLEAAGCTARTGQILVACKPEGGTYPIEQYSSADDRGHSLVLSLMAKWTGETPTRLTLVRINFIVTTIAIFLGAGFLYLIANLLTAASFLLLGTIFLIPGRLPGPDVISVYPALTGFATIAGLSIVLSSFKQIPINMRLLIGLIGYFSLTVSLIFRQSIGMIGLMTAVVAALIAFLNNKFLGKPLEWAKLVAILGIIVSAKLWTPLILEVRNKTYNLAPSTKVQSHGLSHNLYLGLGSEPNSFGIVWADEFASNKVAEIDPSIEYVSPKYYDVLWYLYLDALKSNPAEIIKIYLKKLIKSLSYNTSIGKLPFFIVLFLGVFLAKRFPSPLRSPEHHLLAAVLVIVTAFSLAQGVLATPSYKFIYGTDYLLIMLLAAALAGVALRQIGGSDGLTQNTRIF